MPGRKIESIRWTIEKAATEFDVDRKTLTKKLRASESEPGSDGKYSTIQIVSALFDDEKSERAGLVREKRLETSIKNKKSLGQLVEADSVYKEYEGVFIALRQTILASNLSDAEKAEMMANLRHDITEAPESE